MMTGTFQPWISLFSIPIMCLSTGFMFANNTRDIEMDSEAGIKTVPILIGLENCKKVYKMLHLTSFVSIIAFVLKFQRYGLLLCLGMIPNAIRCIRKFDRDQRGADKMTCNHLGYFGALQLAGYFMGV